MKYTDKNIVKRFSFTTEDRDKLQNIQIGMINAQATLEGLNIYKNVILQTTYKRLNIDGEPKKGYNKSIQYNLTENLITYTEEPIKEKK